MATPQRTMSRWAAGSRSVAALLAACSSPGGTATEAAKSRKRASWAPKWSSPSSSAVAKCVIRPASSIRSSPAAAAASSPRQGRVGGAQPAHAAVELHVHADRPGGSASGKRAQELGVPGHHVGLRGQRHVHLLARERSHHKDPLAYAAGPQARGLGRGGHRQPVGAARQRRPRGLERPMPVAVGLDHGAQLARRPPAGSEGGRSCARWRRRGCARGHAPAWPVSPRRRGRRAGPRA